MLIPLETGITLITKAFELVDHQLKRCGHRSTLLRLLYLELCSNLELFSVIKSTENLRQLDFNDQRLLWIVEKLEMKILYTLLLGDEEDFNAIGSIKQPDSAGVDEEDSLVETVSYLPETPFQTMKYLGRKINFLKVLAASPDMATSTGVKVGLRLERIEKLCNSMVSALGQVKSIRPMTRT